MMRFFPSLLVTTLLMGSAVAGPVSSDVSFTDLSGSVTTIPSDGNVISVSLADYDNDGDLDLLYQGSVTSGQVGRGMFRNNLNETSSLSFTEVTDSVGPAAPGVFGWSAAWADVNGDGFVDLFLGQNNSGSAKGDLFYNQAGASLLDVSSTTINDPGFHQNVGWADMNNDELLDLVIGMEGPEQHEIYLQQPDGSFDQVGEQAGLHVPFGTKAYGTAIADADNDGDLDIYISTCRFNGSIRNNFFRNNLVPSGTLSFTDIADTNGTQYMPNSYHAEFQDFDNDGWLDLFMVGADGEDSKIWRNDQDGNWTDVDTILEGPLLSTNGGDYNGGKAIDYDNDGDLDLFFHDHKKRNSTGADSARALFRNDGNWEFTEVTSEVDLFEVNRGGYDSAWGDIDLDGDMDLVSTAGSGRTKRIFLSDANTNGNNWIQIRLIGDTTNTRAVGATLKAVINQGTPQEVTLTRLANTNIGTFNQSDLPVHIGIGTANQIDELTIIWPDDTESVYNKVSVNKYISINKTSAIFDPRSLWMVK